MDTTIGTCSICGGRVTVPAIWMGLNPPIPTCQSCGATKKQPHGEIVVMEPAIHRGNTDDLSIRNTSGIKALQPSQATDPVQHTDAVGGEGCKATTSEIKP